MGNQDDSMRYSTLCTEVMAGYIRRATRFNIEDVRVIDARPTAREFIVSIRHKLEVVAAVQDCPGKQSPGIDDVAIADLNWYRQQAALQTQAERARLETLDSLIASVTRQTYAAISEKTCIRTHPRRFLHPHACDDCSGAGIVVCNCCAGAGRVACTWCHGRGNNACHGCHGSGTRTVERTVQDCNGDSRTETYTEPCSCAGGRVSCSWCAGTGQTSCGTCSATGRLTCSTCSGHGCLTRITSTHTYTRPGFSADYPEGTPDYVNAAVRQAGFPNLARYGVITLQKVVEHREKSSAEFVYICTIPFCELTVELMGDRSEWVLFGMEAQVFDAGGALEALLESDLDQLRALSQGRACWLPWFHMSARKALTPFLASVLNQEIIVADNAGLAPYAIRQQIARSVSQNYIQHTLDFLHMAVHTAARWSRVKWMLALILLSMPFALLATACLHHGERIGFVAPAAHIFFYVPTPSGIKWSMGLLTLPFTLPGCFLAHTMSRHWLRKAGGDAVITWANRRGLLPGIGSALAVIVFALGITGAVFNRWPLWIDVEGKVYGTFALFAPPQAIEPLKPACALSGIFDCP